MKLSPAQNNVLNDLRMRGASLSAYDLQCSLSTLYALRNKGLVTSKGDGIFSPRTDIEWAATSPSCHGTDCNCMACVPDIALKYPPMKA